MKRDQGVVLINALVIVLAISAVAAALLTRSEAARIRAENAQGANQLSLYLDGIEALVPTLLQEVAETGLANDRQAWAQVGLRYPIDRGAVAVRVTDLQGLLNVNWLASDDDYVQALFSEVFIGLDVPQSLLLEIADFVSPGGPGGTSAYLARRPSVLPRGGSLSTLNELRQVLGMTPAYFAALQPVLAALPKDSKLNLNTAPEQVLKAALRPLPADVITDVLTRTAPLQSIGELRRKTMEILETEDIEHLPLLRFTVGSGWFRADLAATLDGQVQHRQAVFFVEFSAEPLVTRKYRWAVYD